MTRVSILCVFVVALLLAAPCARAAEEGPSLAPMKAWAKKYPHEEIGGKKLWDLPSFQSGAKAVLSEGQYAHLFTDLRDGVSGPIEWRDNVLFFSVCEPHACALDSMTVYADLAKNKLFFCVHDADANNDLWLATGAAPVTLEATACTKDTEFYVYRSQVKE